MRFMWLIRNHCYFADCGEIDIVIVIDISGCHATDPRWEITKDLVECIVDGLLFVDKVRIGLVVYNSTGHSQSFLIDPKDEILTLLEAVVPGGRARTSQGVQTAVTEQFLPARGDRPLAPVSKIKLFVILNNN